MKPKRNPTPHAKQVRYRWTAKDGTTHRGQSVVTSKTKHGLRAAFKRFFLLHPHVQEAA